MSGFYDPGFPHSQDVAGFPGLSTDSLLPEGISNYDSAQVHVHHNEYGEDEQAHGPKRRRPSRPDHVKHRRTRNGCYTCRSRRVKCDEQRPTCERCSKGKRECTYPEPRPNPRSTASSKRDQQEQETADDSRSPSIDDEDVEAGLERRPSSEKKSRPAISRHQSGSSTSQAQPRNTSGYFANTQNHGRYTNEQAKFENSLSPSTESSSAPASAGLEQPAKFSSVSTSASIHEVVSWSHLPGDLQYYLDYHQKHITYHHYFFKHDTDAFLPRLLSEQALQYDPLLYAVVGFAAFHMTVKRTNGRIQDFLGYYDKSVSSLRKSLAGGQSYTEATFLTTLQLATFEEYLGDYVSLLFHQQAAYRMLVELYAPETFMMTELGRHAVAWYSRFDLTSGLMSENGTSLGREWFLATERWYQTMSLQYPSRFDYKIELSCARHRTVCFDLALLFSKLARWSMTAELQEESNRCREQLDLWFTNLDPALKDEQFLMKDFDGKIPEPADIVNPYVEIWREPLYTLNFMLLDWNAMSMLFKLKISQAMHQRPPPELETIALETCRLFETIEYWPDSPAGSVLKAQHGLGIACLFLPKDDRHTMWCRRKLAKIESLGHVYPPTFRQRMASMWGLPEISQWWLPNEEGCPAVVRSIRSCMGDRLPQAATPSRSEDQRTIKGVFSNLTVQDEADAMTIPNYFASSQSSAEAIKSSSGAEPGSRYASQLDADMNSEDSLLEQSRARFKQVIQGRSEGAG